VAVSQRFAQNKLKSRKKQDTTIYTKNDVGKYLIYERLTDLIGIAKYTAQQL